LSAKDAKNAKEAKIADGRLDCVAFAAPVIFLPIFFASFASFADKCYLFQLLATCLVRAGFARDPSRKPRKAPGRSPLLQNVSCDARMTYAPSTPDA
jgi:hypothetical protein